MVWLQILERDRAVVNDDRVRFEVLASSDPHPMSDYSADCFGFQTVKKAVRQIWGLQDVIVSPGLYCLIFIFCLSLFLQPHAALGPNVPSRHYRLFVCLCVCFYLITCFLLFVVTVFHHFDLSVYLLQT